MNWGHSCSYFINFELLTTLIDLIICVGFSPFFFSEIALIGRYICAPIVIYVFLIHKFCTTRKTVVDDNMENRKVEESSSAPSSSMNEAAVEMREWNDVVNVNDGEILEMHVDPTSSAPPQTSVELEFQYSDSSTEWLISESMK